jgi:predicted metalloprotease with PDZ domain
MEDIVQSLSSVAGVDLTEYVEAITRKPLDPVLDDALGVFGLELIQSESTKPFLGVQFQANSTAVSSVTRESPAWISGIAPGDELLGVDGLRVTAGNWQSVFGRVAKPNASISILLSRRGVLQVKHVDLVAGSGMDYSVVSIERATAEQLSERAKWLGQPGLDS